MNIGFKKLHPDAKPFQYSREGDACMDMFALEDVVLEGGIPTLIKTGIAVEIPPGYEGIVRGRSGYALHSKVFVHVGTIDSNYRGDVGVIAVLIHPFGKITIPASYKIAQFSIHPVININLIERSLSNTNRGDQGYGSSGY